VPNTEFEGKGDGHGYGDCTFLVKQAQPSHNSELVFFRLENFLEKQDAENSEGTPAYLHG
jgi:hypothetical protein